MISWRSYLMQKLFTPEEITQLEANHYTAKVSETQIKFTDDFRDDFWRLYLTEMPVKEIFSTLGYDPDILGTKRTDGFVYNLKKKFLTNEQRSNSLARSSFTKRPPSDINYADMKSTDAIRTMQTELQYLRQEVDFLKKLYALDRFKQEDES